MATPAKGDRRKRFREDAKPRRPRKPRKTTTTK